MNGTLHPGKKKNIGDMMVLETIPSSQERIKAVIISSSAGMKHLISQIIITKKKSIAFYINGRFDGQTTRSCSWEKKTDFFLLSFVGLCSIYCLQLCFISRLHFQLRVSTVHSCVQVSVLLFIIFKKLFVLF